MVGMPENAALHTAAPSRRETLLAVALFVVALGFHAWGMTVGWGSKNLPGVEYRQAQTALSAYWIKQENNFSLAYPTPVLGQPWSVPMEFPLYQWTVVVTGKVTGWGLTKAGRAVSIGCFYLTLPALFLLLGRWGVAQGRRWLVLALVVSCPFYIFYARAFLIETMALMFAVWFWVAFERAVITRRYDWLVLALLTGTGAGLVKVTTWLLYLLPAGAWALVRLLRGRESGRWRGDLGWMAAAVAVPFAASAWWVWLADRIKARNPLAEFLLSGNLQDFNLGTMATRLSPAYWAMKWRIVSEELTWLPLVGAAGLLAVIAARHRLRQAVFCVLVFVAALWVFPVLYALHDYYYVANTVMLLLAVGLIVVGLSEVPRLRWWGWGVGTLFVAAQAGWYGWHYYPVQSGISPGGNALTSLLCTLTKPNEVIVIAGQDWNAMTPYYARRRAVMLHHEAETEAALLDAAFRNLADEHIGALVVTGGSWAGKAELLRRLPALGLSPQPWLYWRDSWIFLPAARRAEVEESLKLGRHAEIRWVPEAAPKSVSEPLAGSWHEMGEVPADQRWLFQNMQPAPVRFFSTFEPRQQTIALSPSFGAHPWTRLVFQVSRGAHVLRTLAWFDPHASTVNPGGDPTDGVEVTLNLLRPGAAPLMLGRQRVDPVGNPSQRGPVPIRFSFELEADAEVELTIGPGPRGHDTRDWVWLRGPLVIE